MRIDKFLSHQGMGSRKDVHQSIQKGQVRVNQQLIKKFDIKINVSEDIVEYQGEIIEQQLGVYLLFHKPKGCITATEDPVHKVVMDYIQHPQKNKLFPVGRLDKDTTGLLLITDDGELAHNMLSPKKHVAKKYYATLNQGINPEIVRAFTQGICLDDGYVTKPAILKERMNPCEVEVIIDEGKYHQIKRMFSACQRQVLQLKRVEMGPLKLDSMLKEGEFRPLTSEEYSALCKIETTKNK